MEIQNLPSVQSIFARMKEIESLTSNPKQILSFPEILDRALNPAPSPKEERSPALGSQPQRIFDTISTPREITGENLSQNDGKNTSSSDLLSFIEKTAASKGLDPNLVKAVIKTESSFNPNAISPKGAMGLMQLMPDTADLLGVDDPMDPKQNVTGGINYLSDLLKKFGDTEKALAAYNAGPAAVKKYNGVPPYSETQDYITKVKKNFKKFSSSV